jgi:hypothetical protein
VTNVGTNSAAVFNFTIPRGNTGATGPATVLSVANTFTGAAGSNASVTISGDAPNQSLTFTIPQGIQGIQGETGSSGATALLTGYVSGAGTVAATDTVIQAVGKLNGNDELKAPIASLYPYIGGKLLTYLDEEAAIADPLISAGDIYRKSAGGVDYVNPDNVPSLDLRFADDKTLTARRGPTPTFTRGSGATYIGSDGLIHGIDTSTTSNSISAASKTFTLAATAGQDQLWRTGDAVEASNGSNIMVGTVTSYDAATQSLVCNMTSIGGSGTFTSWRIGYRGPRFDHTSAGVCRGLLIEEGRTNLLQRSEEFANAYWSVVRSTITTDAATSPDGATTAEKLIADTTAAINHRVDRGSITLALNTVHTVSVFAKASEYTGLGLGVGLSATEGVRFSLVGAGTATSVLAGNTGTIQQLPNGWYRCTCTFTSDATTATHRVAIYVGQNGTTFSYTGDGTSGIFIWGVQLEAGAFATSYIPTTTSSLARSADVCSITGANFTGFTKLGEGSVVVHGDSYQGTTPAFCQFSNDTNGARSFNFQRNSSTGALEHSDSGAGVMTISASPSFPVKFGAARNQSGGIRLFYNGIAGAISAFTTNGVQTRMLIGNSGIGLPLNGCIRSIKHFKKRLSDAKMQTLTAP